MPAFTGAVEPVARIAVATLFNSLWEAALLAFAVWLILRALPNLNATTRYAAWCVALVASLLLPLATAVPQISVQHSFAHHAAQPVKALPVSASQTHPATVTARTTTAPAPRAALRLPQRLRLAVPQYVALGLFAAWVLAAIALLVRLAINLYRLERLKADALPLPVDYRERLSRWSSAEKGGREVRLCICDGIEVPVAVGLFDSMILIPQHLLETLSQEEMDQIMLHELAHLRRADDWTNGLQRFIQALFFFNPAVLYIAQQLDLEREVACDDWVVHQTQEVRPYATCLTKMAEATAWPHRALAAPGVFMTRRGLSVRVERLLRGGRNVRTSLAFGPAGGVVAALVVLFFVLQTVAPTFAFTLPEEKAAAMVAAASATAAPTPAAKHEQVKHQQHVIVLKQIANDGKAGDAQTLVIPAQHVHIKGRTIHTPDVNVDIPERHIVAPHVLPPDFAKNISEVTSTAIDAAMSSAMSAQRMAHANCTGCDFSGQNLSGRSFRGQRMNGSDFSKADLENADFSNSVMVGADFSRANLRGANFTHAVLTGCDFSNADLTGVNFTGAQVMGCDVNARALSPSQASALIHACRTGCDFSGVNLQNQDLHGVSLSGIDLRDADLRGANLSGASFSGVDFRHARMDGANVNGASFTGCDFSGVDIRSANFDKATFVGTKFSNSRP